MIRHTLQIILIVVTALFAETGSSTMVALDPDLPRGRVSAAENLGIETSALIDRWIRRLLMAMKGDA